ncbi:MAG: antitoxin [Chlorobi bacterium]|nr:antitoxin [Chlorobiota bacterium]
MKKIKLTKEEQLIENSIDDLKPVGKKKAERINGILSEAKKSHPISLRLSNYDLEKLKEKAKKAGIPYQTLVNSVLHKYVTNQLFEEDEIIKFISAKIDSPMKS